MKVRRARAPEPEALLRIARAVATLDLDVVVARATPMSAAALGAGRAVLYLLTPSGDELELVTATGRSVRARRMAWPVDAVGPITRRVLRTGRHVVVRDYRTIPRQVDVSVSLAMRSLIAVPLMVGGERLGCLHIGEKNRVRDFTRDEVELARAIGSLIGVAVKNARLVSEASARLELLRGLSARLFAVQEDERRRIARELHDEAGQSLTAMKLNLELARREVARGPAEARLAEASRLAQEVLEELRRIARDLRPRALDELGLVPALTGLVDRFRNSAGIALDVTLDPAILLEGEAASTAFRFVQEALTNVVLHARASRVLVRAAVQDDEVVFAVSDDGVGFDARRSRGMGLTEMRERAALVGGSIELSSRPGRGTAVGLRIPRQA